MRLPDMTGTEEGRALNGIVSPWRSSKAEAAFPGCSQRSVRSVSLGGGTDFILCASRFSPARYFGTLIVRHSHTGSVNQRFFPAVYPRTSKACLIKRRLSRVLAGDYMLGYGLELDRGCQEHGKVNSADHTLFVRFATCW